jgi:putative transcriptional regulator
MQRPGPRPMIEVGDEDYNRIMQGLAEAKAIIEGTADPATYVLHHREVPNVDVRAIRAKTGLSQVKFAARYGFSAGAVRDWEQGRKPPERANRLLLTLIDRRRDVIEELVDSL